MVDKMELRNNFFSTSFPMPPPLANDVEKLYFYIGGRGGGGIGNDDFTFPWGTHELIASGSNNAAFRYNNTRLHLFQH